jgi:hypothetical protein
VGKGLRRARALADGNPDSDSPPSASLQFSPSSHYSPPSAGGPGQGLKDLIGIGLIEELGVPVPDVDDDLRELHTAATDLQHACTELADSCRGYRSAMDELHLKLKEILTDLLKEVISSVIFSAAGSVFSFGLAAGAGVAKGALAVKTAATAITAFVGAP